MFGVLKKESAWRLRELRAFFCVARRCCFSVLYAFKLEIDSSLCQEIPVSVAENSC